MQSDSCRHEIVKAWHHRGVSPANEDDRGVFRTSAIAALGGVFEFYDFVIFAVFARQIGHAFFPPDAGEHVRTLQAFAVFAVGYFARPFGGLLWAHVGDRYGRAAVFSHTVVGMAACTLLIAMLPGYATLGVLAPVLLVLLRLVQGMALGGELPASICWLGEHAGARRAGIGMAMLLAGVNSGLLLGQGVSLGLESIFGSQAHADWAWRLAFVFGSVVGVVGWAVRRHVGETRAFTEMRQQGACERLPIVALLRAHPLPSLAGFLMCSLHAWIVAALYLTVANLLTQRFGMEAVAAERVGLLASCSGSVTYLLSGWLGDRIGARRMATIAAAAVLLLAWPAYRAVTAEFTAPLVLLGAVSGLFVGAYLPLLPPLFPANVRVSGLAASYDLAAAVVGGTGPFLMLWLDRTGGIPGVAWAMMGFAALALAGLALGARVVRNA